MPEKSAADYGKTLALLGDFAVVDGWSLANPTSAMLEEWCSYLYHLGFKTTTVVHCLDVFSALHKAAANEGLAEASGLFRLIKAKVRNGDMQKSLGGFSPETFARIHKLLGLGDRLAREIGMYLDVFAVSVLTGCRPFAEVATLKKGDVALQSSAVATILERNAASNRQYVFALSQNSRTSLQIEKHLEERIAEIFESRGIRPVGSVWETARCYWAYSAVKRGFSLVDVHKVLGTIPMALPAVEAARTSPRFTGDRDMIVASVGEAVLDNPVNWYAMRLRQAAKFEEVQRRIEALDGEVQPMELFYPAHEIMKRTKGASKMVMQPVIPGVVFFKSKLNNVAPLFAGIGDLAWCYRNGGIDKPYAVISRNEMISFQRAVGQFTSDFEVGPIGSLALREGDTVKVVGGLFDGKQGELLKIMGEPEVGVIYRLKIIDEQGVEWRVRVDSRFTEPG